MAVRLLPYKITSISLSHVGLIRQNNEDAWAEISEFIYVLADGMGGHQAGEIASNLAVNSLCDTVDKRISPLIKEGASLLDIKNELEESVRIVNNIVFQMGKGDEELKGMGTTLCCLLFHSKGLIYCHVGDSRIYRFRNNKLDQLTKDHSLVRELVDLGQLNERQATDFHYKNIITKAIGTESSVSPSVRITDIANNDIYFMCSDGLSDMITLKEMEAALREYSDINECANRLVQSAINYGGNDNITLVMTKIESLNEKNIS